MNTKTVRIAIVVILALALIGATNARKNYASDWIEINPGETIVLRHDLNRKPDNVQIWVGLWLLRTGEMTTDPPTRDWGEPMIMAPHYDNPARLTLRGVDENRFWIDNFSDSRLIFRVVAGVQ